MALDALFASGRPFNIIVRTLAGGNVEAEGRTAGGRAILRLRDVAGHRDEVARVQAEHQRLAHEVRASRALLDTLPMPVWLRGKDGRLTWVNNAYVKAVDAHNRAEVQERQIELLEQRQRRTAARMLSRGESYRGRVPLIIGGERRLHDVTVIPYEDATAAAAIDVTAIEKAQGDLDRQIVAYDRTLDRVASAVAVFSRQQQLIFFNEAYAKLWKLDPEWLKTRPTDGAVLDRLRELGRLPEVVNYPEWKSKVLSCYGEAAAQEDWWHLPDGRMLHVMTEKRSDGGVTYLFIDETERLGARARLQRADRCAARNARQPQGRRRGVRHRRAPQAVQLGLRRDLAPVAPRARRGARTSTSSSRSARAQLRRRSQPGRASAAPPLVLGRARAFEGQMVRPDQHHHRLSRSMPLPDGATLLTFADVTDAKRYERALEERNEALVAADRMKNALHQPRLLRAAHAADQHHRLQRVARQSADRARSTRSSTSTSATSRPPRRRCSPSSTTS